MVNKYTFYGNASDYKRFGHNEIFGEKVMMGRNNILNFNYYRVDKSEDFMANQGYYQAEKVMIRETWTRSKGGAFPGDNHSSDNYNIDLLKTEGLTYARPEAFNKKIVDKDKIKTLPSLHTMNLFIVL